jgi:hypothetical protein
VKNELVSDDSRQNRECQKIRDPPTNGQDSTDFAKDIIAIHRYAPIFENGRENQSSLVSETPPINFKITRPSLFSVAIAGQIEP